MLRRKSKNMKKSIYIVGLIFFSMFHSMELFSQNVAVNTSGTAAVAANMFEVTQSSTTNNYVSIFAKHNGAATNAYAIWAEATGATNNYAIVVPSTGGSVGVGTILPISKLHVQNSGSVALFETNSSVTSTRVDETGYSYGGVVIGNATATQWNALSIGGANRAANGIMGRVGFNSFNTNNNLNTTIGADIQGLSEDATSTNYGMHLAFFTRTGTSALTEYMRLTSAGALAFNGASNYGSSGQVLTSNGNAPPTWAAAGGGSGGGSCFNNWQLYISGATSGMLGTGTPGSFTVPATITTIKVAVWGGGGGGGGGSNGSGGGGGGYAEGTYVVTAGTVYQITIGAAGGGGASTVSGTAGGTTCFSTAAACGGTILISASPGQPGLTGAGNAGGAGGIGSGGYLNTTLGQGGSSNSPLGAPGSNGGGYNYTSNASAGSAAGGGGGVGGGNANSFSGSSAQANSGAGGGGGYNGLGSGGNGASGKIIVYW